LLETTAQQLSTIAETYSTQLIELYVPSQNFQTWSLSEAQLIAQKFKSLQVLDISNRFSTGFARNYEHEILEVIVSNLPNLRDIIFTGFIGNDSKSLTVKEQCTKLGIRLQY
jgi:hypothetical protein